MRVTTDNDRQRQGKRVSSRSAQTEKQRKWKRIGQIVAVLAAIAAIVECVLVAISKDREDDRPIAVTQTTETSGNGSVSVSGDGNNIYMETTGSETDTALDLTPQEALSQSAYFIGKGRDDDAARIADAALKQEAEDEIKATLFYNSGLAHARLGEFPQAHSAFDQAVKIKPFADAYYALGLVCVNHLGRYDLAVEAFDNALALEQKPEYEAARASAYACLQKETM